MLIFFSITGKEEKKQGNKKNNTKNKQRGVERVPIISKDETQPSFD